MIPEVDWAYAAGIIDGEGCISLGQHSGGIGLALQIIVGMKGDLVTPWLFETFGGSHYPPYPDSGNVTSKWILRGDGIAPFLEGVIPFLKLKKPQAELALAFAGTRAPGRHADGQTQIMRHRIYELMLHESKRSTMVIFWSPSSTYPE